VWRRVALCLLPLAAMTGCTTIGDFPPDGRAPVSVACKQGVACNVAVGSECFTFLCKALVAEEVNIERGETRAATTLTWHLPQATELRFASDGIVFDAAGFSCHQLNAKEFQCVDSAEVGRHKYTVRLEWRGHSFRPLDPWVVNK